MDKDAEKKGAKRDVTVRATRAGAAAASGKGQTTLDDKLTKRVSFSEKETEAK